MARLCLLVCRVDDEAKPDELTELSRLDLPALALANLAPLTALDQLETQAVSTGQEVSRRLLRHQWETIEPEILAAKRQLSPPGDSAGGRE